MTSQRTYPHTHAHTHTHTPCKWGTLPAHCGHALLIRTSHAVVRTGSNEMNVRAPGRSGDAATIVLSVARIVRTKNGFLRTTRSRTKGGQSVEYSRFHSATHTPARCPTTHT
jgi:hypothetical protein